MWRGMRSGQVLVFCNTVNSCRAPPHTAQVLVFCNTVNSCRVPPHTAQVLVFCNTVNSCRAVEHYCTESGVATVCYHGEMPVTMRQAAMAAFSGNSSSQAANGESGSDDGSEAGFSGRRPVMVATDVAARGLDFPGQIDHVVNFDFPVNPVDYIHRSGRTARAGRSGE
eukprot:11906-Chlamydomonas_euryale.AAC.3